MQALVEAKHGSIESSETRRCKRKLQYCYTCLAGVVQSKLSVNPPCSQTRHVYSLYRKYPRDPAVLGLPGRLSVDAHACHAKQPAMHSYQVCMHAVGTCGKTDPDPGFDL